MSRRQKRSRLERRRRASVRARALQVGGGAVVATLAPAAAAHAATFNVTNLNNTGAGSLRQAMTDANTAGGTATDDIVFASTLSGTVNLASDLPNPTVPMDIQGPGARKVTLDASDIAGSFFAVISDPSAADALTISGLSMDNSVHGNSEGGFLRVENASLTLTDDSFSGNRADYGGAVATQDSAVKISGSTFAHNHATASGGGALGLYSGTVSIYDSTIVGNAATGGYGVGDGGGITLKGQTQTAKIVGSTITDNAATYSQTGTQRGGYGGGIAMPYDSTLTLENSVVAGNTATGNSHASGGPRSFRDLYINDGTYPASATASFSLIQNDTSQTGLHLGPTDILGTAADVGPLQNNGGPTDTELPSSSSPVINAGKAFGLTQDQRGLARTVLFPGRAIAPGGDGTDMGSVELPPPAAPAVSGLSRKSGSSGELVTINGSGFSGASRVLFGSASATFTVSSASRVVAKVPAGKGSVDVRVKTGAGESAAVAADKFSYLKAGLSHKGKVSAKRKGNGVLVLTGLTVNCPVGGDKCRTTVSGEASVPASLARVRRKKTKRIKVGSATVVNRPGHRQELEFKLNSKALKALKKKHSLRITVTAKSTDGSVKSLASRTITIRLPKTKKKG